MKTANLFLFSTLVLFSCVGLHAQVTIGGLEPPKDGAVLDLNSTLRGGLILSNVALDNLYTIPYSGSPNPFPGITAGNHETVKAGFAGAMVYHTGENNIPAGVYLWNGENWSPAGENCQALTSDDIELLAILSVNVGSTILSASTKLSDRCSEGEIFTWSATTGVNFPEGNIGSKVNANFSTLGDYMVTVTTSSPYSTASASKNLTVYARNLYGIVGSACLDVRKSPQIALSGDALDIYNDRIDAFADAIDYTKTYKFVHGSSYSDLSLTYEDASGKNLVTAISSPSADATGSGEKNFTVTFNSNIKDLFDYNGSDSSTVKLRADYKNSNGELKTAYLDIRLKDGYCVCPAKIGANTLLNFMCHNLGGLDIISSDQIITRAHHGGYYRFGAKDPSYDNVVDNLSSLGWTASTPYVQSGGTEWRDDHNPCPAGWKLPTGTQWGAFTNYYNANSGETFPFPVSTWIEDPSGSSVVDNGKRFGVHLYLPVSGARHIDGALFRRGYHGSYWSSTSDSTDKGYRMFFGYSNQMFGEDYRYFAGNVRCVSE